MMPRCFVNCLSLAAILAASITTCEAGFVPSDVGDLADGGQLVGTVDGNDFLGAADAGTPADGTGVNGLIGYYNDFFSSSLALAGGSLGRILDDGAGAVTENSPLDLNDFTFYVLDPNGTETVTIGATSPKVSVISDNSTVLDPEKHFVAFKYDGPHTIEYYTGKSGTTWSLWSYLGDGVINPLYTDADADLDTTLDSVNSTLSHYSFYGTAVPEPASMALFGLGAVGLGLFGRRRQRKQEA